MPPDTDARKDGDAATLEAPRPEEQAGAPEALTARPLTLRRSRMRRWAPSLPGPLARYGAAFGDFLSYLAAEDRRRRNASIGLAIALNILVLSLMAAYGRIRIWIPATPGESLSVVMVELPVDAILPELRDPDLAVEPEVEPEPEIIEDPELEPEPAPNPVPAPEPEETPEPEERAIDLTPDPVFAPPSEDETGALIPAPDPGLEEEPGPLTITEEDGSDIEPAPPQPEVESPQSPDEDAPPLTEETPAPDTRSGLDVTVEDAPGETAEIAPGEEDEVPPAGDDMFDEEPVFGPRTPLPSVDLPEGAVSATPGASGVVAIFCPEHFDNEDKAAECAGRTEIRSGWKPGSSGEDWSGAVRLLREARERGEMGDDPEAVFGPEVARGLAERQRQEDLELMRRGVDDINNPAATGSDNIERGLDRPTGPEPFEPSWTLPDDPNVSRRELRKLEEDLEEAEAARRTDDD